MASPIIRVVARLNLPFVILFAIYLLLRGHLSPGGGFIAGVMVAAVVSLQYVAFPQEALGRLLRIDTRLLMASGLALSAGAGLGAIVFGFPFLTSEYVHFSVPVLGEFEVSSTFVFDSGIFLVVIGSILTMISSIMTEA